MYIKLLFRNEDTSFYKDTPTTHVPSDVEKCTKLPLKRGHRFLVLIPKDILTVKVENWASLTAF